MRASSYPSATSGTLRLGVLLSIALGCGACTCSDDDREGAPSKPAPSASAAPALPECQVAAEKTWPGAPNPQVPLVATRLDEDRVAVGLELTTLPASLVFDRSGRGESVEPPLSESWAPPPDGATRELWRVTPAVSDGKVVAYVDYQLTGGDERRVRCGRPDSKDALFSFEGAPLLTRPGGGPLEHAPVSQKERGEGRPAGAGASGAASKLRALARSSNENPLRELRSCRTFVDSTGKAWAVGTELVAGSGPGSAVEYRLELVTKASMTADPVVLHRVDLGSEPTHLPSFEAPEAHRVSDDRFLLAVRHQGGLLVWDLDREKKPRGKAQRYSGGYPSPADLSVGRGSDDPLLVTSMRGASGKFAIRYARMGETLPRTLDLVDWGYDHGSRAAPHVVATADHRFVTYEFGETGARGLALQAVDARMQPQGPPLTLGEPSARVAQSQAIALGSNRLLVVSVQTKGGAPRLKSQIVTCL